MSILDNLSRQLSQGIDRAKFEAERFQKTLKLQGELSDLRKQIDGKRLEFADRALELYRAGQIQSATLGEILRGIESLQISLTLKEEEYKRAQADVYVEPPTPSSSGSQQVPISIDPTPAPQPPTNGKSCPHCGYVAPTSAMFCPSCGNRLGV